MAARHPLYLPPELAFEIAKHLDGYTLLRVSKVSHLWHKAALSSLDNMSLAGALSAFRTAVVNANHEALICFASHIRRNKRTSSATGCMALTWACTTTCPEAVRILVPYASMPCKHQRSRNGNGNDINAWDEPLLEAMRQQDPDVLAALLQNGAPRDRIWFCGLTAQGLALALAHSSRGSPTPESPKRFLHAAISRGFPAAARYVLNGLHHDDDPGRLDAVLNQEQQHGDLPLYAAASRGHADIVRILLEYRVNVDQGNSANVTPLAGAVAAGSEKTVKMLLDHGANMEFRSKRGETPLFLAACNPGKMEGHPSLVKLLLERGARVDAVNDNGDTPLLWAVKNGSEETARVLLEHGANANHRGKTGITPLVAAMRLRNEMPGLVQLLVSHKADLRPHGNSQQNPLRLAVQRGHAQSVWILVDAGADTHAVDDIACFTQEHAP